VRSYRSAGFIRIPKLPVVSPVRIRKDDLLLITDLLRTPQDAALEAATHLRQCGHDGLADEVVQALVELRKSLDKIRREVVKLH
jgi:hypothetical protein